MTDSPQRDDIAATITISGAMGLLVEDERPQRPVLDGANLNPLYVAPGVRRRLFEIPRRLLNAHAVELTRVYLDKRVRVVVPLPHKSCEGWLAAVEECADAPAIRLKIIEPEDIDERPATAEVYIGDPDGEGWQHVGTARDLTLSDMRVQITGTLGPGVVE